MRWLAYISIQILIPNMVPRAPGIKELQGDFKVSLIRMKKKDK